MRRNLRLLMIGFAILASAFAMPDSGLAQNCGNTVLNTANHTVTVTPLPNILSYNAYSGMAVQSFTITVARNGAGVPSCELGVYIEGGRNTKTLTNGANTINYEMLRSGTSILYPVGSTPSAVPTLVIPQNQSRSITVSFEIPANQVVPAGLYSDIANEVVVTSVNNANAPTGTQRRYPLATNATVIKSCQLGTPSAATLAFGASDIPNGLPNEGVIKSTNMFGSCTAPAILKLSGQALQPQMPTAPRPNFDSFINYAATGSFNSASVSLNTAAQQDVSSGPTGTSNSVVSDTVRVNVNLKRANPVIAGSYTGTLTITLDPAP